MPNTLPILLISFQIGQSSRHHVITMTSNLDLSSALTTLSVGPGDIALFSLASMPKEIIIGIAEFLCHESLVQLGATCSFIQQIVSTDLNSHWKLLHDKRWSSGKLLRFTGPPSQRPRDGVIIVDEGMDWKAEFIRRVALDKNVPLRLAQLAAEPDVGDLLVKDGADIFNKLVHLSKDPDYEHVTNAKNTLDRINQAEVQADLDALTQALTDNEFTASYEDMMMVFSKLFQGDDELIERNSSDEIYDEMNMQMDGLTVEDLREFEVVSELGAGATSANIYDVVFLDKVLKNKRGMIVSLVNIALRLVDREQSISVEDWWGVMKTMVLSSTAFGMAADIVRVLDEVITTVRRG